jgi:hypothetical protein
LSRASVQTGSNGVQVTFFVHLYRVKASWQPTVHNPQSKHYPAFRIQDPQPEHVTFFVHLHRVKGIECGMRNAECGMRGWADYPSNRFCGPIQGESNPVRSAKCGMRRGAPEGRLAGPGLPQVPPGLRKRLACYFRLAIDSKAIRGTAAQD